MDKATEALKNRIISIFPGLRNDSGFKITSPATPDYNCIAWACHYNDRWMQPPSITPPPLDSIVYWPDGVVQGEDIDCLMAAFQSKGYECCEDAKHEKGFQKVALYVKRGTRHWTHAARELNSGFWTSKLGQANDIQHGTPYTIEGNTYGEVFCIMKRPYP